MANTFKNFRGTVTAATATTIVPEASASAFGRSRTAASTCVVHAIYLSNTDGTSSVNVNLTIFDGTDTYYVLYQVPVPAGSTLVLDKPINLETLDRIQVETAGANDIDVVCATLEIT